MPKKRMSRGRQEQGNRNRSFGSAIKYRRATLHGSEHWRTFERLETIQYVARVLQVQL